MTDKLQKYMHHVDLVWGLVLNNSATQEWARDESLKALKEYVHSLSIPNSNMTVNEFKTAVKDAYEQGRRDYVNFDYYSTDAEDYFQKKYGIK